MGTSQNIIVMTIPLTDFVKKKTDLSKPGYFYSRESSSLGIISKEAYYAQILYSWKLNNIFLGFYVVFNVQGMGLAQWWRANGHPV